MQPDPDPFHWLDTLAGSHDQLVDLVSDLDVAGLGKPSYCDNWSIAQVLSHLGSGAEIFLDILQSTVAGASAPGSDAFQAIWQRWDALGPQEQAESFAASDGRLIEALENLGDELAELHFTMFGSMTFDAAGFLGLRLSEHAIHAWDVAVALDPAATVDADAVELLIDRLSFIAQRSAKADRAEAPFTLNVHTSSPDRNLIIEVGDAVSIADEPSTGGGGATAPLTLPAEALVRLVYGRLDAEHTPPTSPAELEALGRLRQVFPGF